MRFFECPMNDTWARDCGGISVWEGGDKAVVDFIFNGWGLKFASNLDNRITSRMFRGGVFSADVGYESAAPFVLEGGGIDTDGNGTLMTTSSCQLSMNRNGHCNGKRDAGKWLGFWLGTGRRLWLDHGGIPGDDTDGHVDTLARFCPDDTVAYVRCDDREDEAFPELDAMEKDLERFRTKSGKPYRLLPLPFPKPSFLDGYRLPASYANFLVVNGGVLVPGYRQPSDDVAAETLSAAFPGRKVVTVDCMPLLSGHGSLHCVTMNYPKGWIEF
jgi:agmatine/peptidylarginine deiminase